MKEVGKLIHVEVNDKDISTSHQLSAPRNLDPIGQREKQEQAIIVKFVRRDLRDNFYSSRNNLRHRSTRDLGMVRLEEQRIFISESLTQQNRKLFNRCLQAKRDLHFQHIWTKH